MELRNLGLQTTDGKCYFISVDTLEVLEIQFVPEEIENSRRSNLNGVSIIGRNNPKYQRTDGEDRMRLTLDFYSDEENRTSVLMKTRWLKNLAYNDANNRPAQRVQLIWGEMFKKEIWIVEGVDVRLSNFSKQHGFLPQQAIVDITLFLDPDYNLTWDDVNPDLGIGTPDGRNPIDLGTARESDEQDRVAITNNNTFAEMMARLASNLRF